MAITTTSLIQVFDRHVGPPADTFPIKPVAWKQGYIKVCFAYLTNEPKHYRSYQLATMYGLRGPFVESVYALVPRKSIVRLELISFHPAFIRLKTEGIISRTARLIGYTLADEDNSTLAYPIKL
jgi:hypothetical protein